MSRINIIIGILMMLTSMSACKDTRSNREILEDIYKDYTLVQYMREYPWSVNNIEGIYEVDSSYVIPYRKLKIAGKSFEEIKDIYGPPLGVRYDTLIHGISLFYGQPAFLYPFTYKRDTVPIMHTRYFFEDNTILFLFFETEKDNSKVIFGYKINRERIR